MLSKLAARRDRDWEYAAEAIRAGIVHSDVLLVRLPELPIPEEPRTHLDKILRSMAASQ
ncbi:MAG: hypothetical protein ACRDSN_25370 [Pseudonocardiaceae bacterium]